MTPKQTKALAALLTQPTKEKAAAAAGIGLTTLKRYLDNAEFQAEYQKAVSGLIGDAAAQAKKSLGPALCCLREVMEDAAQNGQVRISAARSLLEFGMRLTEQADILTRLDELEDQIGGKYG